ncbi:MAG TPA: kelch repeat-containing protein [Gemmatimonadales bacterium]
MIRHRLEALPRPLSGVVGLLCLAVAQGCGGGSTDSRPPVATVTVTPNPATVEIDSTLQLTATLEDADGNQLSGRTVTWSSNALDRATVDASGLVTGISEGAAIITATSEGKSGAASITVSEVSVEPYGAYLGPGGKGPVGKVFGYWRVSSGLGYWLTIEVSPPVPSTGVGIAFEGGSHTSSVLLAGGYASSSSSAASSAAALIDPETNQVTSLQMAAGRIYHTITPLPGSRALIAGGIDGDVTLSSAEIFIEASHTFALTGSMGEARSRHAAAALPDGRVLITGGLVPVGAGPATTDVASAEIFDPASGTFSPTGDMTTKRFNHSAIALDDGRILVLGGNGLKSAEVFDAASGSFTAIADMNSVHGLGHRAVKLQDGRVLVVGGDAGTIQPTAVAEIFDPATNEFTVIGNMSTPRMLHFAVVLGDGTVLIGGGQDDTGDVLASAELFDPASNTFLPVDDMPLPGEEQAAAAASR